MDREIENYTCVEVETGSLSRLEVQYEFITEKFMCLGIEELYLDENDLKQIPEHEKLCGQEPSAELIGHVENQLSNGSVIKFYFDDKDRQLIEEFCLWLNQENLAVSIKKNTFENQDWQKISNDSFEVIDLVCGISIYPAWESDINDSCKYPIRINPAMAFGTGSHETTALCLEALVNYYERKNYSNVFDFGCGSGILGIGAKALNPKCFVHCYDIDRQAVDNAKENFALNSISSFFKISHVLEKEDKTYDIVFANILYNILIDEYENIYERLTSKGTLILSGILNHQEQDLINFYSKDYKLLDRLEKNDWVCLIMEKI